MSSYARGDTDIYTEGRRKDEGYKGCRGYAPEWMLPIEEIERRWTGAR
jgi:hypothetical protein